MREESEETSCHQANLSTGLACHASPSPQQKALPIFCRDEKKQSRFSTQHSSQPFCSTSDLIITTTSPFSSACRSDRISMPVARHLASAATCSTTLPIPVAHGGSKQQYDRLNDVHLHQMSVIRLLTISALLTAAKIQKDIIL